jgi:hypothetical protein
MSVELILWLFSFASVMVLIGLTAYQASPTAPFASLNSSPCDGECGPNLARGRRSSARFRPTAAVISWGFDAVFGQRCCSSRAIHSVEDGDEINCRINIFPFFREKKFLLIASASSSILV